LGIADSLAEEVTGQSLLQAYGPGDLEVFAARSGYATEA